MSLNGNEVSSLEDDEVRVSETQSDSFPHIPHILPVPPSSSYPDSCPVCNCLKGDIGGSCSDSTTEL